MFLYRFSCEFSLARIAARSPDVMAMQSQAASEALLLNFYGVRLPAIQEPASLHHYMSAHQPSTALLQAVSPWLLSRYTPVSVGSDGNCFFRSVSFALFSTEDLHVLLRLLCVLEVLFNRCLYDTTDNDFYSPFKVDLWLQLPDYVQFVSALAHIGSYCDMLAVLAASSVTQKAIQTLWPLPVKPGELAPFTKLICGRGLTNCRRPILILWTVSAYTTPIPHINHFVPLVEVHSVPDAVIDCDAEYPSQVGTSDDDHAIAATSENAEFVADSSHDSSRPRPTEGAEPAQDDVEGPSREPTGDALRPELGGPLTSNKYLSFAQCIELLTYLPDHATIPAVPRGVKSNVFFVVSMAENNARKQHGERHVFYDDCGTWINTRGFNSVVVGHDCKELYERDGLVCDRKRVDGKQQLVPLTPQPDPTTVRKVTRYFYTLKRCKAYTKRITMVSGANAYICEYLGTFPEATVSHGNCVFGGTEYVRTHPDVQTKIKEQCKVTKNTPKKIYTDMVSNAEDERTCPRNVKQVQNISAAVTAELIADNRKGTNNLADEMLTLCARLAGNDFVQSVTLSSQHAPCVILYTQQQLQDIKRFCGSDAPDHMRSVLCVDRTFNLSSLFLTLTVFKNSSVVRCSSMRPPIWLGPMFLHGDASFVTYLTFFMHLRGVLDSDLHASEVKLDGMVTGSDEEAALVKAMRAAFPNTKHLYCILHCEDNVRDHVTKAGVQMEIKQELLKLLFGNQGLASASSEAEFDNRTASALQYVRQYCPATENYVSERVVPKILNNCRIMWGAPWLGAARWTNNSCESANNVLKLSLDWKPARLTDLVNHLYEQVKVQYATVGRTLIGQGDFMLAEAFRHHQVSYCQWQGYTDDRRQQLIKAFLADPGTNTCKRSTVTSSDGSLTVVGCNKVARKPGQRKRPRTERSTGKRKVQQ